MLRELIDNRITSSYRELHTPVGAGSDDSLDAQISQPSLSRGDIQCIGATTPAEFRKTIEKDRSLERRFQAIKVPPPTEDETIKILDGIKERYETFHQVRYTQDALDTAVYQSNRYIPDRFLPDKAIDIIDEAGARVKCAARFARRDNRSQKRLRVHTAKYERASRARLRARENIQAKGAGRDGPPDSLRESPTL